MARSLGAGGAGVGDRCHALFARTRNSRSLLAGIPPLAGWGCCPGVAVAEVRPGQVGVDQGFAASVRRDHAVAG